MGKNTHICIRRPSLRVAHCGLETEFARIYLSSFLYLYNLRLTLHF